MKKEIEEIRSALQSINAYDEETEKALESLEEAIDEIDRHPALGRMQKVIGGTAEELKQKAEEKEGVVSEKWHELKDHLDEWEDHHPKIVLAVGKVAEALAVVGL